MDIYVASKDPILQSFLEKHLQVPYTPPKGLHYTPYHNYLQMFIKERMNYDKSFTEIKQTHQVFPLTDGGQCCCHVFYPPDYKSDTLVLLLFPTLTSHIHYFSPVIKEACKRKWISVVLNKRGQHCPLLTYKMYPIGNDQDTHVMVQWVRTQFTGSFFALGVSAGAIMMTRYIGKYHPPFEGAVAIGGPLDTKEVASMSQVLQKQMKHKIYRKYPLPPPSTQSDISIHEKFRHWSTNESGVIDVMRIFNPRLTDKHIEREVGLHAVLPHIRTRMLFINSKDDPIFPQTSPPHMNISALFVLTEYGSHACYFKSFWTWDQLSWAEEKVFLFIDHLTHSLEATSLVE